MTDVPPYPLPTGFLHWLAQFLGYWSDGDSNFLISRRSDGWIQGNRLTGSDAPGVVAVEMILRDAKKVRDPESLLGPYPIVISQELMRTWLTPEQCETLRGAWNVSEGRQRILESIEQRIRTLPRREVWALQAQAWIRGAKTHLAIPESEETIVAGLLDFYLNERLAQGALLKDRSYKWSTAVGDNSPSTAEPSIDFPDASASTDGERAAKDRLQEIMIAGTDGWSQIDVSALRQDLALLSPVALDTFRGAIAFALFGSMFSAKNFDRSLWTQWMNAVFEEPTTYEWYMGELQHQFDQYKARLKADEPSENSHVFAPGASSESDSRRILTSPQDPFERDLVYRTDAMAVFAPRWIAERVDQIHRALWSSTTWGEFRSLMPHDEYERVMYRQFDEDGTDRPNDEQAFEATMIWGVGDGDYPPWLAQNMADWIPLVLLEKYGSYETSRLNGDYWEIPEENAENLAEELRALGYTVTEMPDSKFY